MRSSEKIFVAGHRGLVGSAICRELERQGYHDVLLRSRLELDLTDRTATRLFFERERPDYVFLAAAKVGGIAANRAYPADFIRENLEIQTSVIDAAYRCGVQRLLFLGSSCIYPKLCPQPIKEEYLLTGPLEPTNKAYALAKIAGIEMCWSYNQQYKTQFVAAMPTNLYGPNDNFDPTNSHVLPALIRKTIEAKASGQPSITVWGTGEPHREFLFSDDLAQACIFLMNLPDAEFNSLLTSEAPPLVNVGSGTDLTVRELAELVCRIVGFDGELVFDTTRPDGTPRKLLDVSRIHSLGWEAKTNLEDGIRRTVLGLEDRFRPVS
ncbi:GDP-L-fucose synthase [Silvibacterium bohemicum]|uniref:GDP-L-fucose synthase n=1 Tax=Silvibacterium bohemicum TaxID=1577686 RepID=A0A841JXE3_9BACT|nr:GDP-L-fucose synthase [Silvibacterium bohemicum]MBB6143661.1 GDP-L-fucose synthase [Silvibacterium bohemicum]